MERLGVAPDGDLILVVSDKLEICVHSCVLRLTSKVFKAMLGPDFAEGQTPGTTADPKRLVLPEDDAEDMRLLCLLLHNLNNRLPESLSTDRILRFASLIDKYDCSAAAGPMSRSRLSFRVCDQE